MRSHGIIRYVSEHALEEAEVLEREAMDHEAKAADAREVAGVLRNLHGLARDLLERGLTDTDVEFTLRLRPGQEQPAA